MHEPCSSPRRFSWESGATILGKEVGCARKGSRRRTWKGLTNPCRNCAVSQKCQLCIYKEEASCSPTTTAATDKLSL